VTFCSLKINFGTKKERKQNKTHKKSKTEKEEKGNFAGAGHFVFGEMHCAHLTTSKY